MESTTSTGDALSKCSSHIFHPNLADDRPPSKTPNSFELGKVPEFGLGKVPEGLPKNLKGQWPAKRPRPAKKPKAKASQKAKGQQANERRPENQSGQ